MSRTIRRKGTPHTRGQEWIKGAARGPNVYLDRDIQRLPNKAYRSDGVSTKPDFEDMVGHSYTLGKFNRLAAKNIIREQLKEHYDEV